jgi:uncharacterized HAD superfamily protein
MSQVILTDLDEVIFDWQGPFEKWATGVKGYTPEFPLRNFWDIERWLNLTYEQGRELIEEFNHLESFGDLKPLPHVVENVLKLSDAGYKFVAITACAADDWTHQTRWHNLRRCFGHVFDTLHCVGLSQPKADFLKRYAPTYWVEDKATHAVTGADLGHSPFLINYRWNEYETDKRVTRVSDWREISSTILAASQKAA